MATHWRKLVDEKRARQSQSIPKEWLISVPPKSVLDVTGVPETCGLLTARELEITDTTDVEVILRKLASSEWSSIEVTTAFYKRAIVAHQLVSVLPNFRLYLHAEAHLGELFDRDLCTTSSRPCSGS